MKELSSSKFAEKQLKKYGWKKGEGIGKTNQGLIDPIKASFKFDTAGVGFNMAEEFTVNWWEHLYNTTANKIEAKKSSETNVNTKEETPQEKKEDNGILNRKNFFYSRFTKASLLINGETKPIEEKAQDELPTRKEPTSYNGISLSEIKKGKIVSDEDLFKVCEGRTAHKGARHGIKMNGKLARIEEQEKILAAQLSAKLNNSSSFKNEKLEPSDDQEKKQEKKKKKRRYSDSNEADEYNMVEFNDKDDLDDKQNNKKKKKKSSKEIYE